MTKETPKSVLVLEDGTIIHGKGLGAEKRISGEVVFNTGMVGYTETLTDPSYAGQILCFTYPLIGNYGVPKYNILDEYKLPRYFESESIKTKGVIIHDLCKTPNHWASSKDFSEWLKEENIPGIYDIDTRTITMKLRTKGVMMGALETYYGDCDLDELSEFLKKSRTYGEENLIRDVSVKKPQTYGNGKKNIVLLDFGKKNGILRNLLQRKYSVTVLPYDTGFDEILSYKPAGIVISNGPGDPKTCSNTFETIRQIVNSDLPTLGICLGNQILSLALGANTYKLQYGHRGQNKPCKDMLGNNTYITSQNHGYAVDHKSLKDTELEPWFINADDNTVEGVKHKSKRALAVQFHPEAFPGPYDTGFVFDVFNKMVNK